MTMAAQRARSASHGSGSGDAGDWGEEDDDDGDGDGGVFSMDVAADVLEDECSEQRTPHESFALLPEVVFAAAHTGDCQVVRAFLADPRGDVNARDRHTTVLALTLLSLAGHPKPSPCHTPPCSLCSNPNPNPNPGQSHAGHAAHGVGRDAAAPADRATAVGRRERARDRRLRLHGHLLRQLPARSPADPPQASTRHRADGVAPGVLCLR